MNNSPIKKTAGLPNLDALEEFIFCADQRSSVDRDAIYAVLLSAAPALIAAARERDRLRDEIFQFRNLSPDQDTP